MRTEQQVVSTPSPSFIRERSPYPTYQLGYFGEMSGGITKYSLKCPSKDCRVPGGHIYKLVLLKPAHPDAWEFCPVCGYGALLVQFIQEVTDGRS